MSYVDEQARKPAGLRLAYITPAFPWISHVFEQNEIVGLQANGCDVMLLSCIRPAASQPVHAFARHLLDITHYASMTGILRGIGWGLLHHPIRTLRTAGQATWAALSDRERAWPHLGIWALAICFAPNVHRYRADWIHADFAQGSATAAWYLHRLLNIPFSYKAHAYDIYSTTPGDRERALFFDRKTREASIVFCVSEYGLRQLCQITSVPVADKAVIHRVGIRAESADLLADGNPDAPPHFVALGRLVPKKGFDRLVRAVATLAERGLDITCSIHGDGPLTDDLDALVRSLNLHERVRLAGAYHHEDLPDILRTATALVVPSVVTPTGDMDGIPTVVYEAMAMGRPVVASRLSGIPEVIEHGHTGWLVEPDDVPALAATLEEIATNPQAVPHMTREARAYVLEHHNEKRLGLAMLEEIRTRCAEGTRTTSGDELNEAT